MKWLADKADTSDMTVRFKSRRKNEEEIRYTMVLSKNFKEYIREEGFTNIRFGYEEVDGETKLILGLNKENQGASLINSKGNILGWFQVSDYIEQYQKEDIHIELLKAYKVSLRKNNTLQLDLIEV